MNYRHGFHAGNFADVIKHAVLAHLLTYLTGKDKPLRYLDTHAGIGRYDLDGDMAQRTGEARDGLDRLMAHIAAHPDTASLFQPYLDVIAREKARHAGSYPGSPVIAAALLRPMDRLILCELHPEDNATLFGVLQQDLRVKVLESDGFMALKAHLPPVERRGLILIDPAFEERNDLERTIRAVNDGLKRFATGVYCIWHRIKSDEETNAFYAGLARLGPKEALVAELRVDAVLPDRPLAACGLVIINPPYGTKAYLEAVLPVLLAAMKRSKQARTLLAPLADWA